MKRPSRCFGWPLLSNITLLRPLLRLLALLGGLGAGASRISLGFLLGNIPLSVGLVLLCLALADHVVAARHGANRFLGLALDVLDDALDAFLRTSVLLVGHSYLSA